MARTRAWSGVGRRELLARSAGALALLAATGCGLPEAQAPYAGAPADWNPGAIAWQPYGEGLAAAKAQRRPVCLVFYTDWCPHCHNYSQLFHAPEIVALSKQFVMIRVERDGNRDISEVYAIDGEYIPRTFFLTSTGLVLTDLASDNEAFRYFFDEHDPSELESVMQRALERTN